MRALTCVAIALLVGCASPVAPAPTARLTITPDRFVVDGAELVSADELHSYLVTHSVRDAHIVPQKDVSYARVAETMYLLQNLGVRIGLVGNVRF